jgi:hypothetical protein
VRRLLAGKGGVAALVAACLAAGLAAGGRETSTHGADDLVLESSTSGTFSITGRIVGLYPGKRATLWLTLVNRNDFALNVTSISIRARDAKGACTADYLVTRRFSGSIRVRARSSRRLGLTVFLRRTAPDACIGARFPLSYRGRAYRA